MTYGLKTWKQYPATAWILAVLWLLLISFLAFFWNLGSIGLIDETEPLFAEAARQMTVTGDWITPYFNQATRFDKPPLIYWLMAIAYSTFGVNEFAARLPSALAGLTLTCFCFYTLFKIWQLRGKQGGNFSTQLPSPPWQSWFIASLGAAIVALHPQTLFFGRTGYSDMLLSACMGGGLLAFFLGYAQPLRRNVQARWYLTCYVLLALAVLTKGPVGVVLPGLTIGAFLLYVGTIKDVLREMCLGRGALLFLVITVPWYILVTLRNGETYINSFFGYHNFERFTSVVNEHQGPWYFHILVVLIGFAPWSIALPAAIAQIKIFQRRRWQNAPRQTHLGVFALFWFFIVLGFFTIATTKYFSYTLPLMPAAAILVALWWGEQLLAPNRFLRATSVVSIALFFALAVGCFLSPQWLGDDPSMPNLGVRISQAGLSYAGAAIWGISAIASLILFLRQQSQWLWGVKLLGFIAFLMFVIMPASTLIDAERQLPLRQIAHTVVQQASPGEELLMFTEGFEKPSLVFYTQRPINFVDESDQALPEIQQAIANSGSDSALVITTRKALPKIKLSPNQYQDITQAGIYQLIRVSKTEVF